MTGSKENTASLPHLCMVIGGARSGKSRLAERLVSATARPRIYIATAEAWDDEMRARIAAHRASGADRVRAGTPSRPRAILPPPWRKCRRGAVVLVDCATLWLTQSSAGRNRSCGGNDGPCWLRSPPAPPRLWWSPTRSAWSIVPENALARAFRDAQGRLNQRLAAQAGLVVAVIAGLPLVLKGRMPEGMT